MHASIHKYGILVQFTVVSYSGYYFTMMSSSIAIISYKHIPLVNNPISRLPNQIIESNMMNNFMILGPYQIALQKKCPIYQARRKVTAHLLVPNSIST